MLLYRLHQGLFDQAVHINFDHRSFNHTSTRLLLLLLTAFVLLL
jgi:hypothetical protein